jgi:hypothetical protein
MEPDAARGAGYQGHLAVEVPEPAIGISLSELVYRA